MSNSDRCVSSLSSAAPWRTDGCMAPIFTLGDKNTETEAGCVLHHPACKEEVTPELEERNSSLIHVKPEPLQIEEELLQRLEEAAGSALTLVAVKREYDRDTEPLASTSTEHMETQADVEDCGASSQPTSDDQLLSSHRSESNSEDSDFWEETRKDQDLKSSKNTPSTSTQAEKKSCSCTVCGRVFSCMSLLKRHMRTHPELSRDSSSSQQTPPTSSQTGNKCFTCADCGKVFVFMSYLKKHMKAHAGEKHCTCTDCGRVFGGMGSLKQHMRTHTRSKNSTDNSKDFGLKAEPLQIKEEKQEELLHGPEQDAGSTLTSLAVKREDDDDENRETASLASTSTEHIKTQAVMNYCVPSSQPANDDPSNCSESDITEDSDDWEETTEDQPALNKLNLHETENMDGQRSSLSSELSRDSSSSRQTPPTSSQTENRRFSAFPCTECGLSLQIKEEQQEELLQGPEEAAGSTLTLLAVKSEDDNENRDTPLASTSTEHMETQSYITYCVPSSEPTNNNQLKYHEQFRELFQDLKSSKQRKKGKAGGVQRCTECGKGFPCMANLKLHMITHAGLKPVSCTLCGKGCSHLSELRRHLVRHAGDDPISCTDCGKPFRNIPDLRKHMRFHTGEKPFHCYYCSKVFDDRSRLKEHMSSHKDKLFICPECGKVYICISALKQHVRFHTSHAASQTLTRAVDSKGFGLEAEPLQIKEEQQEESPQRPEEADDDENRDTEPLASTSTEHMETQAYITYCVPSSEPTNDDQLHSSNCSESDVTEDRDDSEEPREDQSSLNKRNSENMEGRRVSLRNKLAWDSSSQQTPPTSSQTENKCFRCTDCSQVFSSRSHLTEHMRVHTGDPPYACTECGKVFLYLSNLKDHMVSHADETPIIRCTDCGKPFGNIPHLKSHIRVHTGVKPFICYHCKHVFDYRIHLKQHMSSHSHMDEKLFSCSECSKVFVWMSALEIHMKAHTEKR